MLQRALHYPDGAGLGRGEGYADLAAQSIYDRADQAQLFGDLEVMKGLVGLWQFAACLAHAMESDRYYLFPSWRLSPYEHFSGLVARIESDSDYAESFARATTSKSARELNVVWREGLRERLQTYAREAFDWPGLHEIPKQFAT